MTYRCVLWGSWPNELSVSDEHDSVGIFDVTELAGLRLPDGYRLDIAAALA